MITLSHRWRVVLAVAFYVALFFVLMRVFQIADDRYTAAHPDFGAPHRPIAP